MEKKVTSHNQSGGITAGNVIINKSKNIENPKNKNKFLENIYYILGIILAIITIFSFMWAVL